jgi:cell division protein FtsI/penicillin-binding protein 2
MSLATRACVATYGLAALFTALSARLYQLAVHKHEYYAGLARDTYEEKATIFARRGSIVDAHNTVLARNEPLKNVIVDDTLLFQQDPKTQKVKRDDRARAAAILGKHLKMTPEEVLKRIPPGSQYFRIGRKVSEEIASAILQDIEKDKEKQRIRGIRFEQDFERIYPAGSLLCHVLGFYGNEQIVDPVTKTKKSVLKGIEGVERSLNDWLTGQDGWRYFEKDGLGREMASYRREERAPRNGANVRLTIDLGVQQIVEDELERSYKELKPKKATVIIMDPKTGAVLAMANRPGFDPNHPGDAKPEMRFNHAVAAIYEPGSTFKTLSAAGALNRGLAKLDEQIWCRNGTWAYPGGSLTDHHPYGNLSVADVIAKSSNIGAVTLAKRMGERPFYELIRNFGFGSRTGIALPGESAGILHRLDRWRPSTMFHVPFGHEVAGTPLQVTLATSVFANGGNLMMPQILKDITDDDGHVLVSYQPQVLRANIVKEETCKEITAALEKVTSKIGTATRARVPGFRVAGKTGTTQLFDKELGRYSKQDHVVSFVGYLPAEDPKFCCLVMMEDSEVVNGRLDSGGLLAAPVFSRIAERTAHQIGLKPDPVLLQEELEFRKALAKEGR